VAWVCEWPDYKARSHGFRGGRKVQVTVNRAGVKDRGPRRKVEMASMIH
jgi:hypothetical protein